MIPTIGFSKFRIKYQVIKEQETYKHMFQNLKFSQSVGMLWYN